MTGPPILYSPGAVPGLYPPGDVQGEGTWRAPYPWWYPESAKGRAIEWATLGPPPFLPVLAMTTDQDSFTVSTGFAFVILESQLVVRNNATGAVVTDPDALVQLQDGNGDANLFNVPQHVGNVFGSAQRPHYWQVPRILAPGTVFNVVVSNLDAVVNYRMYFAFGGFRIWGNAP